MQSAYGKPLPVIDEGSRPFWTAARQRRISVQRCSGCGHLRFPPARICPRCRSDRSRWVELSGRGTVWSFTVFHKCYFPGFADEIPYNVAVVELDEGVRMFTNVVGVANSELKVGMRVRVEFFDATDEVTLIKFRPDVE